MKNHPIPYSKRKYERLETQAKLNQEDLEVHRCKIQEAIAAQQEASGISAQRAVLYYQVNHNLHKQVGYLYTLKRTSRPYLSEVDRYMRHTQHNEEVYASVSEPGVYRTYTRQNELQDQVSRELQKDHPYRNFRQPYGIAGLVEGHDCRTFFRICQRFDDTCFWENACAHVTLETGRYDLSCDGRIVSPFEIMGGHTLCLQPGFNVEKSERNNNLLDHIHYLRQTVQIIRSDTLARIHQFHHANESLQNIFRHPQARLVPEAPLVPYRNQRTYLHIFNNTLFPDMTQLMTHAFDHMLPTPRCKPPVPLIRPSFRPPSAMDTQPILAPRNETEPMDTLSQATSKRIVTLLPKLIRFQKSPKVPTRTVSLADDPPKSLWTPLVPQRPASTGHDARPDVPEDKSSDTDPSILQPRLGEDHTSFKNRMEAMGLTEALENISFTAPQNGTRHYETRAEEEESLRQFALNLQKATIANKYTHELKVPGTQHTAIPDVSLTSTQATAPNLGPTDHTSRTLLAFKTFDSVAAPSQPAPVARATPSITARPLERATTHSFESESITSIPQRPVPAIRGFHIPPRQQTSSQVGTNSTVSNHSSMPPLSPVPNPFYVPSAPSLYPSLPPALSPGATSAAAAAAAALNSQAAAAFYTNGSDSSVIELNNPTTTTATTQTFTK